MTKIEESPHPMWFKELLKNMVRQEPLERCSVQDILDHPEIKSLSDHDRPYTNSVKFNRMW